MPIIHIEAEIVETLKRQRDWAQAQIAARDQAIIDLITERDAALALVEEHEATITERDQRIAALEAERDYFKQLSEALINTAREQMGLPLPFEDAAQESDHAPADLSMRGGLEYVNKRLGGFRYND